MKRSITKFLTCVLIVCFSFNVSIFAAPAYPYPIQVKQPDGDKITIFLKGDEFFNYTMTEEGYILLQDQDGFYNYAEISGENKLVPSNVRVTSEDRKKSSRTSLLKASSPEFIEKIQQPALKRAWDKRMKSGKDKQTLSLKSTAAVTGNFKGLIILAGFKDLKFTINNPNTAFTNMLNQKNYSEFKGEGSARDYLIENSNGTFIPEFDVFGPVELPHEIAYYGADNGDIIDPNAQQMIIDACKAAKEANSSTLNFSDYDFNQDGIVDNVFIFYAGTNQAEGGETNTIWSHKYTLASETNPIIIDGVTLGDYACTSEIKLSRGVNIGISGIGTFMHEFSHVLGLPDLYDADQEINGLGNASGTGVGYWCTMGYGGYLNEGRTPPYYGAIERWVLGWISLWELDLSQNDNQIIQLSPISSNQALVLETPTPLEFFSFESRKKEGWDKYLPSDGMVVYHIDYTPTINKEIEYNNERITVSAQDLWHAGYTNIIGDHPCMELLRANNNLENDEASSEGHPFPQQDNSSLSDVTSPGLLSWTGEKSGAEITDITKNDETGVVSFLFKKETISSIESDQKDPLPFMVRNNCIQLSNLPDHSLVELYDAGGKKQIEKVINGTETLTVPNTGMYILKIRNQNKVLSYKVLIK